MKQYIDEDGNRVIEYEDGSTTLIPKEAIGLVETEYHKSLDSLAAEIDEIKAKITDYDGLKARVTKLEETTKL